MDAGRYCTATFLDVSQAFDKVWHASLLHKIKNCFLPDLYALIYKSYHLQRTFRVQFGEMITQLKDIVTSAFLVSNLVLRRCTARCRRTISFHSSYTTPLIGNRERLCLSRTGAGGVEGEGGTAPSLSQQTSFENVRSAQVIIFPTSRQLARTISFRTLYVIITFICSRSLRSNT